VKIDTPEPVCSYRHLIYKTSYQFVGIKREQTSFSIENLVPSPRTAQAGKQTIIAQLP